APAIPESAESCLEESPNPDRVVPFVPTQKSTNEPSGPSDPIQTPVPESSGPSDLFQKSELERLSPFDPIETKASQFFAARPSVADATDPSPHHFVLVW